MRASRHRHVYSRIRLSLQLSSQVPRRSLAPCDTQPSTTIDFSTEQIPRAISGAAHGMLARHLLTTGAGGSRQLPSQHSDSMTPTWI